MIGCADAGRASRGRGPRDTAAFRGVAVAVAVVCAVTAGASARPLPVRGRATEAADHGSTEAVPRLLATRAQSAPTIDGKLDEAVWQTAVAEEHFVQKSPHDGEAPSEDTTLRVLYDDSALYVAFDCVQQRVPVVARLARRDRPVESDFVAISIDTRRDGTSAFEFTVNAAGSVIDGIRFDDTQQSTDWDEIWEARTARTERGWSAELRIPLRILRFDTLDEQEWGFQARRYISMLQETIEWSHIPLTTAGEVSHYGRLGGLRKLTVGGRLELWPFVVAHARWADLAPEAQIGTGVAAGLDLRVHLTQNLTLDAAFYPDFAQAESDPAVLNLATFEHQYPETRAFFIAGFDVFQSPIQLLYSRRIGLAPPTPEVRDGEVAEAPEPTKIYATSKLVGTLGSRLTIGALAAVTARNEIAVRSTASEMTASRLVAPVTAAEALRLRLAVGKNAYLGAFGTAVDRFEPVAEYPAADPAQPDTVLCPDGATRARGERCFHDAYVAGVDGRWRSASGAYALSAQGVVSKIAGGPPRELLDGTVIAPGDVGTGGKVELAKEGGTVLAAVKFEGRSRDLDFNDLGFMDRQNHLYTTAALGYRILEPLGGVLETSLTFNFFDHRNLDLVNLLQGYALRSDWKLASFWTFAAEAYTVPRYFDDRQIGTGAALQRAASVGLDLHLRSDPRRWLAVGVDTVSQRHTNGSYVTFNASVLAHALPQLELELRPQVIYSVGEPHFVATGDAPAVLMFGRQDARSASATLRANYTFTPRLSLQLYSQLFLAAEHYSSFTPSVNPDTEVTSLQINTVFRWEVLPGSTLFIVFTRGQSPEMVFAPGQRAGPHPSALRDGPGLDQLLIKWVYWLG
ncbi:MAG: hypothetical protein E6J91_07515 [Deltaproteobacteria bacterium]|nr:MAG: hypothetical protein E6J91_07515 [Deltaproteobacteria bacterium]